LPCPLLAQSGHGACCMGSVSSTSDKVDVVREHVTHVSHSNQVDQRMNRNRNTGDGCNSCRDCAVVVGERHVAEDDVCVHVNGDQVMLDVPGIYRPTKVDVAKPR
jgi:hypothetical protein